VNLDFLNAYCIFEIKNLKDVRFKPVGGPIRRPSATNGGSTLRGDEESACARKLDNSQLSRKAPVELTANRQGVATQSLQAVAPQATLKGANQ
jgi:hypothetical protein